MAYMCLKIDFDIITHKPLYSPHHPLYPPNYPLYPIYLSFFLLHFEPNLPYPFLPPLPYTPPPSPPLPSTIPGIGCDLISAPCSEASVSSETICNAINAADGKRLVVQAITKTIFGKVKPVGDAVQRKAELEAVGEEVGGALQSDLRRITRLF